MSTAVIVLAGGRATRLGPLAFPNKAMVSVRGRPMIAHHADVARAVEADRFVVVVPPGDRAVAHAARRACPGCGTTAVEAESHGPVHALRVAMDHVECDDVVVLFADSLLDASEVGRMDRQFAQAFVASPLDLSRSYCVAHGDGRFHDGLPTPGQLVFVGGLAAPTKVVRSTLDGLDDSDDGIMSPFLTALQPTLRAVQWRDVGDFDALAAVMRDPLPGRGSHSTRVTDDGYVQKTGTSAGEATAAARYATALPGLFPRVRQHDDFGYEVELVDSPSVAELMLYWELTADATRAVARRVTAAVESVWTLSTGSMFTPTTEVPMPARPWIVEKAERRLTAWSRQCGVSLDEIVTVEHSSGTLHLGSPRNVLKRLGDDYLKYVGPGSRTIPRWTTVHGDPNLTNVLYSPRTQVVRLIDPRGRWETTDTLMGDAAYDVAKLRYSYQDGFIAVAHDLLRVQLERGRWHLPDYPVGDRFELEVRRLAKLVGIGPRGLETLQALILLAAPPLHPPGQGQALFVLGMRRAHLAAQAKENW